MKRLQGVCVVPPRLTPVAAAGFTQPTTTSRPASQHRCLTTPLPSLAGKQKPSVIFSPRASISPGSLWLSTGTLLLLPADYKACFYSREFSHEVREGGSGWKKKEKLTRSGSAAWKNRVRREDDVRGVYGDGGGSRGGESQVEGASGCQGVEKHYSYTLTSPLVGRWNLRAFHKRVRPSLPAQT